MNMPRAMTRFKTETKKVEKHSFVNVKNGMAYAEFGKIKTYSNRTQADKKVKELSALGMLVGVSSNWPYTIKPKQKTPMRTVMLKVSDERFGLKAGKKYRAKAYPLDPSTKMTITIGGKEICTQYRSNIIFCL